MEPIRRQDWKVSLHGGHSVAYCDHAFDSLREILEAAVAFGYHTFGVSEHVPRAGAQYLYDRERELGWTTQKIADDFDRYARDLTPLVEEFADRLIVLRGFEAEVVPADYPLRMRGHREQTLPNGDRAFDYFVGSVHFVQEFSIDGSPELFDRALEACDGLENLAVQYYNAVAQMAVRLEPDVVGHFDLIKKNVLQHPARYDRGLLDTPRVRKAAETALVAIRSTGSILDLNTAGWRKGLGEPYPAPACVQHAQRMGIPFCFGDDSHRITDVGAGIVEAHAYLRQQGLSAITVLTREGRAANDPIVRRVVSLE